MKIKLSLLLLVVLFTLQALAQEVTLRIAATSDLHGSIFPFDFEEGQPGRTSLEGVGYLVDSLRIIPGSNLVLLDNGDLVQGTQVAYYANFLQKRRKNLFSRMLNSLLDSSQCHA